MPYTAKVSNTGFSVDTNNDGIPDGRAITIKNAGNFNTFSLTNGVLTLQGPTGGALPAGSANSVQYNDGASGFAGEADFTYDPATNTLNVDNVIIDGNLTVSGTTTTVNTTEITIADNIITLNSDYSGSSPTESAGIKVNRGGGSEPDVEFLWDETNDRWDFDTYALGSVGKVYASGSNAVYTFTSDTDTGIEHTGTDQLGLLVGATRVLMVNANGVHIDPTGASGAGTNEALRVDNITIDTNTIASADTDGDITLHPNGAGQVRIDTATTIFGDAGGDAIITTNGPNDLILQTSDGATSGTITIQDGANNNIIITPNGTGNVGIAQGTPTSTLHVGGDVHITGGLTVEGTSTTVNTTNTLIADAIITVNEGETGAGVSGNIAGFEVDRGPLSEIARFVWDDNTDVFRTEIESGAGAGTYNAANLETAGIYSTTGTFTGDVVVDTNVLYVDTTNNYVGINKTPTVALDVTGTAKISSDLTVSGDTELTGRTLAHLVTKVENATVSTISKGTPVYISGTHASGRPQVEEADANGTGTYPSIGIVYADISAGSTGYVITFGTIEDVAAARFVGTDPSAGDTVYLSETVGKLTVDRPTASGSQVQNIGRIAKSNVSVSGGTGTAHVLVQGPGRTNDIPNDIDDVAINVTHSPINYSASANQNLQIHLSAIDTQLGSAGSGTVTSVAVSVPTGLTVSPTTITTSGTFAITYDIGYSIPTTAKQVQWDTAFSWGDHAGLYVDSAGAISAVEGEATLDLTGAVTVTGDLTVDTDVLYVDTTNDRVGIGTTTPEADLNVVSASAGDIFVLECTDAGAISGPDITLIRDSSSPADDDFLGRIVFKGRDDGGNLLEYGNIKAQLGDATNGSEGFNMFIQGVIAGTNRPFLGLRGNDGLAGASQAEVCINDQGIDMDFRVETDTDTATLFVQGSTDRVGISTTSPVATLDVDSGKTFRATRLLTVSVSSGTLTEASHAGRYILATGNISLPATSTAGEHYTILNTSGGDITVSRNGNNINGAASDATVGTYNGITAIAIGSNNWLVLGV